MGNLDFSANADQLKELAAYMASQINVPTIGIGGGYAPLGTINFFDATVAPQDWLACDGSVYNIADYPQLAEWYATQHGASNFYGGNGTTTFAVPDLQGEFLRGTGTNSHTGNGNGGNVGEHQDGTLQMGLIGDRKYKSIYVSGITNGTETEQDADIIITGTDGVRATAAETSGNLHMFKSRPTNTSFLICVKAVVAGDVYSTEERVVGTWIDGKKLYQKTINCGTVPSGVLNGQKIYSWLNSNIENAFVRHMFLKTDNGIMQNLPYTTPTNNDMYGLGVSVVLDRSNNELRVILFTGVDRSSFGNVWITVCYTKTTD